jgi:hypothetical protein
MFWNRRQELAALGELDGGGGLAVVWGRRRIGKPGCYWNGASARAVSTR